MPGQHTTDHQMRLYMHLRQHNGPRASAAKAGFSTATAYRIENEPQLPSTKKKQRGRRRPDSLAGIFDEGIVPMLEQAPDLRSVGVFEELMCRCMRRGRLVARSDRQCRSPSSSRTSPCRPSLTGSPRHCATTGKFLDGTGALHRRAGVCGALAKLRRSLRLRRTRHHA